MIRSFNFVNHVPAMGTLLWQYLYRLEENDMNVYVLISDCKNLNMHYFNFAYTGDLSKEM